MSEDQVLTGLSRLKRELVELKSHLLEIEEFVVRLESETRLQESPAPMPLPNPLALSDIAEFASDVEQAGDQEAFLACLLNAAGKLCGRALLMVENELGGFSPWNSFGFEPEWWQKVSISREDPVALSAKEHRILTLDLEGGGVPESLAGLEGMGKAAAIPIAFGERTPAVLVVTSSAELQLDSLRLLVELTRLYIQNHFLGSAGTSEVGPIQPEARWPKLESLSPVGPHPDSPSAGTATALPEGGAKVEAPIATPREFEPDMPPPAAQPTVEPEVGAAMAASAPPISREEEEPAPEVEVSSDTYELDDFPEVRPEELGMSEEEFSRLMGTASSDWKVSEPTPQSSPPTEPDVAAEQAPEMEVEAIHEPPQLEEEVEVPQPTTQEEEVMHSEARRFARLLVAEIKLYNEDEVQEGRVGSDLYQRLKGDIDRSREMYEKRVSPLVRASEDYFHSEMIRVLAQEEAELMGPDYPGPQIGAPA